MLSRFFKDSAIYGASTILSRGLAFLMLPLYARVLSPADYGVVDLLTVFGTLVMIVLPLEISQAVARSIADARSDAETSSYASTGLWFTAAVMAVFMVVAAAGSRQGAAFLLDNAALRFLFLLGVAATVGNTVYYYVQNQLRWQRQPRVHAAVAVTFALVSVAVTAYLVLLSRRGAAGVLYGQIAGYVAGAVTGFAAARPRFRLTFDFARLKEMLAFSLPLVPAALALTAATFADRYTIKEFLTVGDVGVYGVALRIASLLGVVVVGFQMALTPLVMSSYTNPETPASVARIFAVFLALVLAILSALCLFAGEVVALLAGGRYAASAPILALLGPAVVLPQMYVFAPGIFIHKKTRLFAAITIAYSILNIGLNLWFVPRIGPAGAALATLCSALLGFSACMVASQRLYPVPHSWWRITAATGIWVPSAVFGLTATALVHVELTAILLKAVIAAAMAGAIALVLIGREGLMEAATLGRTLVRNAAAVFVSGRQVAARTAGKGADR